MSLWNEVKKEYDAFCKEVSLYLKDKLVEPSIVKKRYNKALDNYRKILNRKGHTMPFPKYVYDEKDKSTWLVLDCSIKEDEKKFKTFVKYKYNTSFKFS